MSSQPTNKWSDTAKWAEGEIERLPPWLREALKSEDQAAISGQETAAGSEEKNETPAAEETG